MNVQFELPLWERQRRFLYESGGKQDITKRFRFCGDMRLGFELMKADPESRLRELPRLGPLQIVEQCVEMCDPMLLSFTGHTRKLEYHSETDPNNFNFWQKTHTVLPYVSYMPLQRRAFMRAGTSSLKFFNADGSQIKPPIIIFATNLSMHCNKWMPLDYKQTIYGGISAGIDLFNSDTHEYRQLSRPPQLAIPNKHQLAITGDGEVLISDHMLGLFALDIIGGSSDCFHIQKSPNYTHIAAAQHPKEFYTLNHDWQNILLFFKHFDKRLPKLVAETLMIPSKMLRGAKPSGILLYNNGQSALIELSSSFYLFFDFRARKWFRTDVMHLVSNTAGILDFL